MALAVAVLLLAGTSPSAVAAHSFGDDPLDDVLYHATNATRCAGLPAGQLAAMMLAPTWPETGAGASAPSPMTLGRADIDPDLWSFGAGTASSSTKRAFWHAGIGLWQLDDSGMAASATAYAGFRISSWTASALVAQTMADRFCSAGGTNAQRRAWAWAPWFACSGGACETLYQQHYCSSSAWVCNVTRDSSVGRYGGGSIRSCRYTFDSTAFTCWYINPSSAQESTGGWRYEPVGGSYKANGAPQVPSPLAHPFYAYWRQANDMEYRHWIAADTGYSNGEIYVRRPDGVNSRSGNLQWVDNDVLCDLTANRGPCATPPPLPSIFAAPED
jgi:hypothetical protein